MGKIKEIFKEIDECKTLSLCGIVPQEIIGVDVVKDILLKHLGNDKVEINTKHAQELKEREIFFYDK